MPKKNTIDHFKDSRKYLKLFKIIFGVSVFTPECENGKINSKFNLLGFMTFVIWGSVYYYSLYAVINEDHTVLRKLYDTRLKHYGDAFEVLTTMALVVYGTWKAPFDLSGNPKCVQCIVDIDKAIEELGENLNFKRDLNKFLMLPLLEIAITITRVISTYNLNLNSTISITKMIQMLASDYMAFLLTAHFCFFLYILQIRYEIISKVLENIQKKESREFVIIRVQKHINNGIHPQDIYLCDKLKKCGKICSMLHNASVVINKKFGFAIVCTMGICLALVVLYLYYFMEATASGLFHDPKRYINFMVYVLWVIIYALFLIFLSIYFCERAIEAAKKIADRAHDIINSNMDLSVSREGTKSVVTFLVIMLQFVTDNHSN
ncbi:uncharacterized protein LOC121731201 [Aricia agestis]|uniref:uncharacterized protein LOC121731201 n=1 Tax=Aricia agestis TaxID=91739 RepID=UPI001C208559|nr:uncharacterized protein LOC121731201 [Aricia agestis]